MSFIITPSPDSDKELCRDGTECCYALPTSASHPKLLCKLGSMYYFLAQYTLRGREKDGKTKGKKCQVYN
jgi:hypothetical protein